MNQVVSYGAVLRKCERNSTDTVAGKFAAIMGRWLDVHLLDSIIKLMANMKGLAWLLDAWTGRKTYNYMT